LILAADDIAKAVDDMEGEVKQLRSDVLKMCWYMRGGLTYQEALHLSHTERQLINDIIRENLETTKKTRMPFF
jgi:hypothetical protein